MEFLCHLSVFILLVSGACKSSGSTSVNAATNMVNPASEDYRKLAEKRLGAKVQYAFNEAHTMVLCITEETPAMPALVNSLRFIVIFLKNNTILYENKLANAKVEWHNNAQLKVNTIPGTVQVTPEKQKAYYLYDVETKRKLLPPSEKL